jgi:hypothetical protein
MCDPRSDDEITLEDTLFLPPETFGPLADKAFQPDLFWLGRSADNRGARAYETAVFTFVSRP